MTTHETADIEVLSTKECWELLRDSVVGRLAVTVDGRPDIFPVNPVVDHGSIVFRTSAGTKLAATKGHEVAFEVDGYDVGDREGVERRRQGPGQRDLGGRRDPPGAAPSPGPLAARPQAAVRAP